MTVWVMVVLLAGSVLVFIPGLIAGWVAWSKGYRPWFWLLSMGPIGALVITLIPGLAHAKTPEERERMESRADWTGGILSGFTILPALGLPLIVVLLIGSMTSGPVAPPPMMPAPSATVIPEKASAKGGPAAQEVENEPTPNDGPVPARQQ